MAALPSSAELAICVAGAAVLLLLVRDVHLPAVLYVLPRAVLRGTGKQYSTYWLVLYYGAQASRP